MKLMRKCSCLFLALLLAAALPVRAMAATVGDFDVTLTEGGGDPVSGTDYSYSAPADSGGSGTLSITSSTPMTVTNNARTPVANDSIVIDTSSTGGGTANVTLKDVTIDASGTGNHSGNIAGNAAVSVKDSSANITLEGDNTLSSGARRAGLEVNEGASVSINGTNGDSLTATGGVWGAGIGGGRGGDGGDITINGGTVTADGGKDAFASIGGNRSGNITINGGTVKAGTNVSDGAGIGGQFVDNITINGGDITANGKTDYAGIGSYWPAGTYGTLGILEINGGNVTAVGGSEAAAGIGSCLDITITGGTVTAQGGNGTEYYGSGAGIGSRGAHITELGYSNGSITITGGTVNAAAGTNHPDFSGAPTLDIGGSGGKTTGTVPITITGGTVNGVNYDSKPAAEKIHKATGSLWDQIHWELSNAEPGSEFIIDAGSYTWIPRTIIETAQSMDITLIIKWDGGKDITIQPADETDLTNWSIQLKDLVK